MRKIKKKNLHSAGFFSDHLGYSGTCIVQICIVQKILLFGHFVALNKDLLYRCNVRLLGNSCIVSLTSNRKSLIVVSNIITIEKILCGSARGDILDFISDKWVF